MKAVIMRRELESNNLRAMVSMRLSSTRSASSIRLSAIDGVAASTSSLCRAFDPMISGMLYSASLRLGHSVLPWRYSDVVSIAGAIVSLHM